MMMLLIGRYLSLHCIRIDALRQIEDCRLQTTSAFFPKIVQPELAHFSLKSQCHTRTYGLPIEIRYHLHLSQSGEAGLTDVLFFLFIVPKAPQVWEVILFLVVSASGIG